jgi:hypothetical protein
MLYRNPKGPSHAFTVRLRQGLYALAAARRRRLLAFATLDQKGDIGRHCAVLFLR